MRDAGLDISNRKSIINFVSGACIDISIISTTLTIAFINGTVHREANQAIFLNQTLVSPVHFRGGSRKIRWVVLLWAWLPHPQVEGRSAIGFWICMSNLL